MPPKKRNRDDDDAEVVDNKNEELAGVFERLMMYESKGGSKWASIAYQKVVKGIRTLKKPITAGADVKDLPGFGKAAVTKIDEYLATGALKKLTEFEELHGKLSDSLTKSAAVATAGGGKKGATKVAEAKPPTKANLTRIKKQCIEFQDDCTKDDLVQMLKTNGQASTGTKGELAERCAQGKVLGRIPVCPLCGAGKLRFDLKTGMYKCPGFMDDDTFSPCIFTSGEVTREEWCL